MTSFLYIYINSRVYPALPGLKLTLRVDRVLPGQIPDRFFFLDPTRFQARVGQVPGRPAGPGFKTMLVTTNDPQVSFVLRKVVFWKLFFKFFCVCLLLEKLRNEKHFSVKGKFSLVSRKVFSFYFERKTLSRSCEKFRNIILFADYIKFGPQTFDCYIFSFESFFFSFIP
jgi:hypothetical protein